MASDRNAILAPDSTESQLARNLDICLTVPKVNGDVADFLFTGLERNPLHAQFPLRLEALTRHHELLCINLFRRISQNDNPFYPIPARGPHVRSHARLDGLPENRDMRFEEDLLFFPVAYVDGFIFGYFSSERARDNTPASGIDPWTDQSFGRFVFHTSSRAFYMSVYGGEPPYIGMRVKIPRGSEYTDFLDVVVPPGEYGRSKLPTQSPIIVSTPKFPNTSIVKEETESRSHDSVLKFIDEVVSNAKASAPARTRDRAASGDGHAQTQVVQLAPQHAPHRARAKSLFQKALDCLQDSICKNSYSPGLRSDSAHGNISFTGQCEYFIRKTSAERREMMRGAMIDSMQLATFFTMLNEPFIALTRPARQRRVVTYRTETPPRSTPVGNKRKGPDSHVPPTRRRKVHRPLQGLDAGEISDIHSSDELP